MVMKTIYRLLKLDPLDVDTWFESNTNHMITHCILITIIGTALYGITIGLWRGPLQALFVAIKFPLLIVITTTCNALLNWFISLMIGASFSFLRTLKYQLVSYTLASIILLSSTPVSLFFLWNTPPLSGTASIGNSILTLMHVLFIAIAGIIANLRLLKVLTRHLNNNSLAKMIVIAWLAGNMVLGCQISWTLRPFIGSPNLAIQFIRPTPLEGNFYIDVYRKFIAITNHKGADGYE
jgi:hypothetical protein